ncbi:MAG: CPBP family intramembrane metalloprotease [Chloroflexi bacterium]|nr:MAG: CPBP family intramembrane metalloprotease [Chloroflexota bacterium]MBL1192864.1 CPBP family intramembrane metalloprotease [Chloroflexota bacterium]NOH10157.1 CPBP family intramembrane metalloprotease [Chloroflexota bacterium]
MKQIKSIFWDSQYARLRMVPRVVVQLLIVVIVFFPIRELNRLVRGPLIAWLHNLPLPEALAWIGDETFREISLVFSSLAMFSELVVFVISLVIGARFLDRRKFFDFTGKFGRAWWADLVAGILIGGGVQLGVVLVAWIAGWVKVGGLLQAGMDGTSFWVGFIAMLIFFICGAINEEIQFRGYPIRTMSEGLAGWGPLLAIGIPVLLISIAFGFAHAGNPHITPIIQISIMLGGVWMAVAYILTGSLALSIGMHFAWNFVQFFFGFPVSGLDFGVAAVSMEQRVFNVWIGNEFGPESGLLSLFAMLAGFIILLVYIKKRYGSLRVHTEILRPTLIES